MIFDYIIVNNLILVKYEDKDESVRTLLSRNDLRRMRDAADATLKRYDELGWEDSDIARIRDQELDIWNTKIKDKIEKKRNLRSLYLIHNTIQNSLKIGVSADPQKRLRSLQTSTGDYLTLIFNIKGKAHLEKQLHKEFADIRLASEWFKFDKRIIERFNGLRYGRMD